VRVHTSWPRAPPIDVCSIVSTPTSVTLWTLLCLFQLDRLRFPKPLSASLAIFMPCLPSINGAASSCDCESL